MVYYLGTDGDAPRIAWQESYPAFYVSGIESDVLPSVRQKLPHTNLVYLGSHEGCGCGFRRADEYTEDGNENVATTEDHRALSAYLAALPTSVRPPQIFGCWSGDETAPIDHQREISPLDILERTFGFQEREILTLRQK
jgi:hypothetical protein